MKSEPVCVCVPQMDESGCTSKVFNMATFTPPAFARKLKDVLRFSATVAEEGTGEPRRRGRRSY